MPEPMGFDKGRPVLACILFKSLLHWRSLEAERTNIFDRIMQTILVAVEGDAGVGNLAYWLSNTTHLLCLLERTMKPSSATPAAAATPTPRRRLAGTPSFGRMVWHPWRPLVCPLDTLSPCGAGTVLHKGCCELWGLFWCRGGRRPLVSEPILVAFPTSLFLVLLKGIQDLHPLHFLVLVEETQFPFFCLLFSCGPASFPCFSRCAGFPRRSPSGPCPDPRVPRGGYRLYPLLLIVPGRRHWGGKWERERRWD